MDKIAIQHPYALTKYLGEQILLFWSKIYIIKVISLRLFNIYGLRSRTTGAYGAVFGTFLRQKISTKPLTVVGDGKQKRDFFPIENLIYTINNIIDDNSLVKSRYIFNLGNGHSISILELAKIIKEEYERLFDHKLKIYCGSKKEAITDLIYSSEKINSFGLYYRKCQIHESIRNTLIFCRDNYSK